MKLTDLLAQHKAHMRAKGWLLPGEDDIPHGVQLKMRVDTLLIWVKPI